MRNINRYGLVSNEMVTAHTNVNIRSVLTGLEETRANLLLTKELGTYSAEIQQAIINIEQSILYLEHYIGRREKAGIFTVDIPENLSETHTLINKTQMTDVVINVLKDSPEGHEVIQYYKFEKTYLDISDAKCYCQPVTQQQKKPRKNRNSCSTSVLINLSR